MVYLTTDNSPFDGNQVHHEHDYNRMMQLDNGLGAPSRVSPLRMVKCIPMRRDIQWFYDRVGLTVTRNGRDFTIVDKKYADYAWSLQDNGFEYA